MYIDIIPEKVERSVGENGGGFCFDDCICTYARYVGFDWELMFSDTWNFSPQQSYDSSEYNNEIHNKKLILLEKTHGIQLKHHRVSEYEGVHIINKELQNGRPVILELDAFWCPWDPAFQKYHNRHCFLINGFDDASNSFICVDPYFMQKDSLFSVEYYKNGFVEIITFNLLTKPLEKQPEEMIRAYVMDMLNGSTPNYFENTRRFGMNLENIDFEKEIASNKQFWITTIYRVFEKILTTRVEYVVVLKYVAKKYNNPFFYELVDSFSEITNMWNVCRGMLIKISINNHKQKLIKRLSEKMIQIVDEEEQIAWDIIEMQRTIINSKKISVVIPEYLNGSIQKQYPKENIVFADLAEYTNNRGFGTCPFTDSRADFTSYGQCFLMDSDSPMGVFEIDNMIFKVFTNKNGDKDNISCMGQHIAIPEDNYNRIQIMGCSEYGNYSDNIEIQSVDGEYHALPITLYDWSNTSNTDITAWSGKIIDIEGEQLIPSNEIRKIYAKDYTFCINEKIKGIQLPDCPNIHIFALTMFKS